MKSVLVTLAQLVLGAQSKAVDLFRVYTSVADFSTSYFKVHDRFHSFSKSLCHEGTPSELRLAVPFEVTMTPLLVQPLAQPAVKSENVDSCLKRRYYLKTVR